MEQWTGGSYSISSRSVLAANTGLVDIKSDRRSRPESVVQIDHREHLLLPRAADGMLRSGLPARRPDIGHSSISSPILEADLGQDDRDEDVLAFRDRGFPDDLIEVPARRRTKTLPGPSRHNPAAMWRSSRRGTAASMTARRPPRLQLSLISMFPLTRCVRIIKLWIGTHFRPSVLILILRTPVG
jgi:hypothetical protein